MTSPTAYRTCHHFPDAYSFIDGHTPVSAWIEGREVDRGRLLRTLEPFGSGPLVLKDYVKSPKHYWTEACFIPAANDIAAVERVVNRFLEPQGDDFNAGLVFREFVPLRIVGTHPKSGMPLAAEFRIFWLDGEPLLVHRYWGDLAPFDAEPPVLIFQVLARRIPGRFFTMDVAMLDDGSWTIVELGDGQVAGLPTADLAPEFFNRMADILASSK